MKTHLPLTMMSQNGSPKRSVVLLSGGLDSAANLAFCRETDEPILAMTMRYGQKAERRECEAARAICVYYDVRHEIVDLSWLGELGESSLTHDSLAVPSVRRDDLDDIKVTTATAASVWVPNRNGVFINVAASFAEALGAVQVVVGFNKEEAVTFPDNSAEFLESANGALSFSTMGRVRVSSYTAQFDKREIVQRLRELKRPFPFDRVWSCYHGESTPCGTCESCQRFLRATLDIGDSGGV